MKAVIAKECGTKKLFPVWTWQQRREGLWIQHVQKKKIKMAIPKTSLICTMDRSLLVGSLSRYRIAVRVAKQTCRRKIITSDFFSWKVRS